MQGRSSSLDQVVVTLARSFSWVTRLAQGTQTRTPLGRSLGIDCWVSPGLGTRVTSRRTDEARDIRGGVVCGIDNEFDCHRLRVGGKALEASAVQDASRVRRSPRGPSGCGVRSLPRRFCYARDGDDRKFRLGPPPRQVRAKAARQRPRPKRPRACRGRWGDNGYGQCHPVPERD